MDMNNGENGMKCDGKCQWHHHRAIRGLTAVVIALFIFWCGFEFGEIRATIGGGMHEGYRMMQSQGWGGGVMYSGDTGVMRTQMIPPTVTNTAAGAPSTK